MRTNSNTLAINIFQENGGSLRTCEALRAGIQSRTLYELHRKGELTRVERGLFRLSSLPPLIDPNWFVISSKMSTGVFCLISALAFHKLSTHIPHQVYVALPQSKQKPRLSYPPIHYVWLSKASYEAGIETHLIDGVAMQVYSPAKTVADCFKFRNKIGLDIALDALKQYINEQNNIDDLMRFAKINRVQNVIYTYIEALI